MSEISQLNTQGRKDDIGKPRWDLLPWDATEEVVKVLTHGAQRYGENNWQHVPTAHDRYFAAAIRHLVAWKAGDIKDQGTNLHHLAHACCCLLFLMWFDRRGGKGYGCTADSTANPDGTSGQTTTAGVVAAG